MFPPDFDRLKPRIVSPVSAIPSKQLPTVTVLIEGVRGREITLLKNLAKKSGGHLHLKKSGDSKQFLLTIPTGCGLSLNNSPDPVGAAVGFALAAVANRRRTLATRPKKLTLGRRCLVMGIINCTPDSFSDGGVNFKQRDAVDHALQMVDQGADILDVGGQSTRPGSKPVPLEEELRRTIPVIEKLSKKVSTPISIDTSRAEVARQAINAGASIINDITAMTGDPQMMTVAAHTKSIIILMHMPGTPATMQKAPRYKDVISDVYGYLAARIEEAERHGIPSKRIVIDPGIGFGKTVKHNLKLIDGLAQFRCLGCGVLSGHSRKSFLGKVTGQPVDKRLMGTVAATALAARSGADIVRVHDVTEAVDAVKLVAEVNRS